MTDASGIASVMEKAPESLLEHYPRSVSLPERPESVPGDPASNPHPASRRRILLDTAPMTSHPTSLGDAARPEVVFDGMAPSNRSRTRLDASRAGRLHRLVHAACLVLTVLACLGSWTVQAQTQNREYPRWTANPGGDVDTPPVGRIQIVPQAISFDPMRASQVSPERTFTITNVSAQTLTIQELKLLGVGRGQFELTTGLPMGGETLTPGQSAVYGVTWTSAAEPGVAGATIRVDLGLGLFLPNESVALGGSTIGPLGAEVLVNSGGDAYVDGSGNSFSADYGYYRGFERTVTNTISGTSDQPLYQTRRRGMRGFDFDYGFRLMDAGVYEVTLHLTESQLDEVGEKTFDVVAEGQVVLDDLDVFALTGGRFIAHQETFRVDVQDGTLDLDFFGVALWPAVNAIEIRGVPNLVSDVSELEFGAVASGGSADLDVILTNNGVATATIDTVSLLLDAAGSPDSFSILLDGQTFLGASGDVSHPASIALAPGESKTATVTFAPTLERYDAIRIEFGGDFGVLGLTANGLGGHEGDPYLHVVIDAPDTLVDYDADGSEPLTLDGSASHTHEPGRSLVAWDWFEGATSLGTGPSLSVTSSMGTHTYDLTITDDNAPPRTLTGSMDVDVVAATDVPGVWARYYDATGTTASALLNALPSVEDWSEVLGSFDVPTGNAVGGSPFAQDVVVQLLADVELDTAGMYDFQVTGGVAHQIFLDGLPILGATSLGGGTYELDVRVAVDSLADLPLGVTYSLDGGASQAFDTSTTSHDQTGVLPFINSMPDEGTTAGGNTIMIDGFGFFPTAQVVVNWGGTMIDSSAFQSSREPDQIVFLSPAGVGTINVSVTTPNGTSNVMPFTYDDGGPVPIVFDNTKTYSGIPQGTAAVWGPNGHLYVAALDGRITELAFGDDWALTLITEHTGTSALDNPDILGLTINPFDPPSPVRLYVSHGQHFVNGGSTFSGPSPYTGQISVLEGPNFDAPIPVITGLPTSNHDHGMNGIVFDNNGDLLIALGSNTNAGVPHPNSGDLPESPLSAAILKARLSDPAFDGNVTYVDTVGGLPNDDQVFGESVDQATGDVEVHATGLRNPYGLVYTTNRRLFATDNGPNIGFGAASTGAATEDPDPYDIDEVNRIEWGNYYGSPNRSRGRYDAREYVYMPSSTGDDVPGVFTQALVGLPSSCDGIIEYTADTFQGQIRGDLLVHQWNSKIHRVNLDSTGRVVTGVSNIQSLAGLSLVQGPGGAVLSLDYTSSRVRVLEPNDSSAIGLKMFDILPWRAPATGGTFFRIGGIGFGNLGDTSVTIGGLPATLSRVSSNRIEGTVPVNPTPSADLVDVVVTVGSTSYVYTSGFRFLFPVGTEPGMWEDLTPVPAAVGEVAAAEIDGLLYLVGEGSGQTFVYDLINQVWLPNAAPRPVNGHHHAAEVVDGKLYLIGGLDNASEGTVQIYDPATDSWSLGAAMPRDVGSVSTAVIDGLIYAAGGIVTAGFTVEDTAVYDPALDSWTVLTDMPEKRNHAASGTDGTKFYVFGGRVGGNFVTNGFEETQVYDPATDSWESSSEVGSTLAPLPEARGGMGTAIFSRGEFYVFGGETLTDPDAVDGRVYDRVDVYNPVTNTWRLEAPMPNPRHGIYPVLFQGRMFVAGGGVVAGNSQSTVFDEFTRQ